jgi:hypothetical protein
MSDTAPAALLPPDVAAALEGLGRHIAEKAEREKAAAPEPEPKPTAKIVQLDFWENGKRAAPNAVFRSALFPALNFKEGRAFLKEKRLASVDGVDVLFTGEQFDQSDLDVYLELLNLARGNADKVFRLLPLEGARPRHGKG